MSNDAAIQVLQDWRGRGIKKPRSTLPVEETARALTFIRRHACKSRGISECECWEPVAAVDASSGRTAIIGVDEPENVRYLGSMAGPDGASIDPCYECRTPGISRTDFSISVFGENVREKEVRGARVSAKVFLRPMSPGNYYRVVATAFAEQWISFDQARSLLNEAVQIEATSTVVRRFLKRLRQRSSFLNACIISGEPATLFREIDSTKEGILAEMVAAGRRKIERSQKLGNHLREWLLATNLPQSDS